MQKEEKKTIFRQKNNILGRKKKTQKREKRQKRQKKDKKDNFEEKTWKDRLK